MSEDLYASEQNQNVFHLINKNEYYILGLYNKDKFYQNIDTF